MTKKIPPIIFPILLILIVPLLAFWQVCSFSYTMKWDIMDQFFPCRYFISECFKNEIFPLWCPYINFGYPLHADPQGGMFYPVTWLISLTVGYNVYSIATEYVLHVIIASLSFSFLLRKSNVSKESSVVFGIVYSLSGTFISNAQHLTWIVSMAWMPLAVLNFKRIFDDGKFVYAAQLALFLFLALTGGYPGFLIILFYFFIAYSAFRFFRLIRQRDVITLRKTFFLFMTSGILFFLLSSGYLYSFIQSLPYISRGKPITLVQANSFPLSPKAMISFLFPFATSCASFKMGTDISMANVYSGFLLLPFLLFAFVKEKTSSFQKGIFVFAIVCLLAAGGEYFFVRTLLYKYFPGMNMMRHAGIFRVFVILGFVFLGAIGFDWFLRAVRNNQNISFVKKIFVGYWFLLFAILIALSIKNKFHFPVFNPFNTSSIISFNENVNVYNHITIQAFIHLFFLSSLIIILFISNIQSKMKAAVLCSVVIIDMIIAVQLNLPATVISQQKPSELHKKLNEFPSGFPVPELKPVDAFSHFSDGSTLPIWCNISFFKKTTAKDGFNSFYLSNVDELETSDERNFFLQKPIAFTTPAADEFLITKFEPNDIRINCSLAENSALTLQQNFYKGWKVFVDGKEEKLANNLCSMNCQLPAGNHRVQFIYKQPVVIFLFFFSGALFVAVIIFIASNARKKFNWQ